jgi:hypothetical protein
VNEKVLDPGWQVRQAFAGSVPPDGTTVPLMSHSTPHTPPTQIWPLPQLAPSAEVLHAVVLAPG